MKLEKFKERDNKRIGIIVFTIVCIMLVSGVILYRTFAIFEVKTNQNVIKGNVQDPGNLYFAFYVDEKIQKDMPQIGSGYILDENASYCGINGQDDEKIHVTLTEDYTVHVSGMTTSRTKCNLYFVKGAFILGKPIKAVTNDDGLYEVSHEDVSETTNDDGFKETEFRYAGSDPNNYVNFNGEMWRIIGLVNVLTGENKVEQRVKIVKNESIGKVKLEDLNTSDWPNSTFQNELNANYYNQQENYSENGINETSRKMIDTIIWNLGITRLSNHLVSEWYKTERSLNDIEKRNVGLIYPSDYNYAVGGEDRTLCLSHPMYDWYLNKCAACAEKCAINDWIKHLSQTHIWTLTSYQSKYGVIIKDMGGLEMSIKDEFSNNDIYPTLYLKSNVKIIDGLGTEEHPFQLKLFSCFFQILFIFYQKNLCL